MLSVPRAASENGLPRSSFRRWLRSLAFGTGLLIAASHVYRRHWKRSAFRISKSVRLAVAAPALCCRWVTDTSLLHRST